MTQIPVAGQDRPCGLRERKKARTRAAIRRHALRLFRANGYQRTTVEQIAAAAEVSPSTFFRYFPTKEDLILQDDMDTQVAEALARRAGRPADDMAVRTVAGALIGVILSITLPVDDLPGDDQAMTAMFERLDEALALLEAGLPL